MFQQENHNQRAGDGVGQIGDERERLARCRGDDRRIERVLGRQAIAVNKLKSITGATLFDEIREAFIQFTCDDPAAEFEERFGEGAGAWPDFEDQIARPDPAGADELSPEVVVNEKVLPE